MLTLIAVWLVPEDNPKHADIPLPAAKPKAIAKPERVVTPETVATSEPAHEQAEAPPIAQAGQPPDPADAQPVIEYQEGEEAREFIAVAMQQDSALDTLFGRAEEFRSTGKLADAYLLYFQAARQGHAGACMVLAKQADPAFYSVDNSMLDKPYVSQARKWYLAAAEAGDDNASELLDNLHDYVRTQAAAGDPEASRLLLQWK